MITIYELFYRVRGDHGVENVDIARLMFSIRGTGWSNFIAGKIIHNQRQVIFLFLIGCMIFPFCVASVVCRILFVCRTHLV